MTIRQTATAEEIALISGVSVLPPAPSNLPERLGRRADDLRFLENPRSNDFEVELQNMRHYLRHKPDPNNPRRIKVCKDKTIANEIKAMKTILNKYGFTPQSVEEWLDILYLGLEESVSVDTHRYYSFVIENFLLANGIATPVARPDIMEREQDPAKWASMEEAMKMIACARSKGNLRDAAILSVAWYCALRATEITSLKITSVVFESDVSNSGYIHVRDADATTITDERGYKVRTGRRGTKGNHERKVPFDDLCGHSLRQWINYRRMILHVRDDEYNGILFLGATKGDELCYQRLRNIFLDYSTEAGLSKRVTPHDYRRGQCTWLLNYSPHPMRLQTAQKFMGHKNINITMRYLLTQHEDVVRDVKNAYK